MSRSIQYTSSPLLASRTPVWRSKLVVGAIALAFTGLAARAAYIQVVANDFFQRQGEVRFARTLDLPANRGRILDRNGLILASSVPAPSIWAIPEDVDMDKAQLQRLSRLLEMPACPAPRPAHPQPSLRHLALPLPPPLRMRVTARQCGLCRTLGTCH